MTVFKRLGLQIGAGFAGFHLWQALVRWVSIPLTLVVWGEGQRWS
ncbi:hypothetical protein [Halomonas jincaotanensis]|nr:hypothetical protein [Halomonas jincaotanensis]